MGWFADREPEKPVFDHETLKRDAGIFDFPPEIPAVGQVVKVAYYANQRNHIVKIETTVINRTIEPVDIRITVHGLTWGNLLGSQELTQFQWNRASKKWYFWDVIFNEFRPVILTF